MSKASEWAKHQPKDLHLRQLGSPFSTIVFLVNENGRPAMRIDNSGPYSAKEARRLIKWITAVFGETP